MKQYFSLSNILTNKLKKYGYKRNNAVKNLEAMKTLKLC